MRKGTVSFCLFGDDPKYTMGAIDNSILVPIVYPDYVARFYVSSSVRQSVISRLKENNSDVILYDDDPDRPWLGTFIRFLAMSDSSAGDVILFRDADSRVNFREKAAVDEWIASGKAAHLMRDHVLHQCPMMAGMWGIRAGVIADFKSILESWPHFNNKCRDQDFLVERILPLIKDSVLVHDTYGSAGVQNDFPEHSAYNGFVGEIITHTPLFLDWHLGLGDILLCAGIARWNALFRPVIIPCQRVHLDTVKYLFDIDSRIHIRTVVTDAERNQLSDTCSGRGWDVLKLGWRGAPSIIPPELSFDQWFYKQAKVPFDASFSMGMFNRDMEKEDEIAEKLLPGYKTKRYAWVHEDVSRGICLNKVHVSHGLQIFTPHPSMCSNLLLYASLLEHAEEVHGFDSAFMILADRLSLRAKRKILHFYAKTTGCPAYKTKFDILNSPSGF